MNYLNVCSPSEAEQGEIASALRDIPLRPSFAEDFEVARGRSTMEEQQSPNRNTVVEKAPVSDWVRIRREFPASSAFSNAQYSFSTDKEGMTETLALRRRDVANGGVLQISFQDSVTAGTPEAVLSSETPSDRIRIERSGKSSLVLARCAEIDQSKMQPLFQQATNIMAHYRSLLFVRSIVPGELNRTRGEFAARKQSKHVRHPGRH